MSSSSAQMRELVERVQALRRPEPWPDHPDQVRDIETHFSWVFLTRSHAFKLKKPTRLIGQDLRDLAARREAARNEVLLNQRLAPDVYLGYVPLVRRPDGSLHVDGAGEVVDWLVRMRRLPEAELLDGAIRDGRADPGRLRPAALHLARFYVQQDRENPRRRSYLARIRAVLRTNRRVLEATRGLPQGLVEDVQRDLERWLAEHEAVVGARARRVVEGHGDLRPEHVFLGEPPAVIDCLEFDRRLRMLDPVDELAFLGVASERIGAPHVGRVFLDVWAEVSGDAPPDALVAFYGALRACSRARLAALRSREPGEDHAQSVLVSARWLRCAEARARTLGPVPV